MKKYIVVVTYSKRMPSIPSRVLSHSSMSLYALNEAAAAEGATNLIGEMRQTIVCVESVKEEN